MLYTQTLPVSLRCLTMAVERVCESALRRLTLGAVSPRVALTGMSLGSLVLWTQGGGDLALQATPAQEGTEPSRDATEAFDPQSYHLPVLPGEVVESLQPGPGKLFLDATLGGGGHSELLLRAGAEVVALDQDGEALAHARERLRRHGERFRAFHANFRDFATVLSQAGIGKLDGVLADLGVSSRQLDKAERGFSFMKDGPLDMRMNTEDGRTAADLVNEADAEEIERVLREYGEERLAKRIARAIVERREKRPFTTTADLAAVIAGASPRHGKTHPATQSFQAIRIAVNEELAVLGDFLNQIPTWLKPGGRLALISFHSMEDRMVKHALARYATEWLDRPEWPAPRRNPDHCLRLLHRKPLEATAEEVKANPRARSAKLRSAEKIAPLA